MFDGLAPEWTERHVDPVKAAVVNDALDRGEPPLDGRWIELGSGTGAGDPPARTAAAREQVSVDLSPGMLAARPDGLAPKVRADSSQLPFADDSLRCGADDQHAAVPRRGRLACSDPAATVVWINTLGDQTPIHLPPADVERALPGEWTAWHLACRNRVVGGAPAGLTTGYVREARTMSDRPISRFDVPDLDDLPDDIREQILAVQEKSGFVPNVFLAFARRPAEFRAFFAFHDALDGQQRGLSKAERELIVVATSARRTTACTAWSRTGRSCASARRTRCSPTRSPRTRPRPI